MNPTCAAAQQYLARGFLPIPIPHGAKAPTLEGWPALRLTVADLPRYFDGTPCNIGLVLGDDFGTTDVDLDCAEAIGAAPELLPDTRMIFGRTTKRASHFFYRSDPPVKSRRFLDPVDKHCLVELRGQKSDGSTGLQTIAPPSTHPSGELVAFEPGFDGHPANVEATTLQGAVIELAAASLLARHWPPAQAGRNAAFLALAGVLARAGWAFDHTLAFHRAIYRALWNGAADFEQCAAEVKSTYEKHSGHAKTTGGRSLRELVDAKAVSAALTWLGIERQAAPAVSQKRGPEAAEGMGGANLMTDETIVRPEMAIEGLLPACGCLLLGGRPKEGKSWLAVQIASAFVTGEPLCGWLQVLKPGRAHLWALEDGFPITKDKLLKLHKGRVPEGMENLRVFDRLERPFMNGGAEIIEATLNRHPAELVVLDSLMKLKGRPGAGGDITQEDYALIDRARRIALAQHAGLTIVAHTKKGAMGRNPIEDLIGTTGFTAATDAVAELKRHGPSEGHLLVAGRCVPSKTFELAWFEGEEWGWAIQAAGEDVGLGVTSQEIVSYLEAEGAAKPATVAKALHKSFGAVWRALHRLQASGKVWRGADRRWGLAGK